MMNYLLVASLLSFCLQMFAFSCDGGKIKRCFIGFDFSYAEQAVDVDRVPPFQPVGPYFNQPRFRKIVDSYFETNLKPYLFNASYQIQSSFEEPREPLRFYTKATVHFSCTFDFFFHYEDSKSFVIVENDYADQSDSIY